MKKLNLFELIKPRARARNILLLFGWLALLVGVIFSLLENPTTLRDFKWVPVFIVAITLAPATMACNALGFIQSGRLVGLNQGFSSSLKIVTAGTLANQLPIPAAFMMRVAALKAAGAGMAESVHATLTISLMWLGCAFLISSIAAFHLSSLETAATLLTISFFALAYSFWRFRRLPISQNTFILAIGILISLLDGARIYLCFKAIGITPGIAECLLFTAASALSNIVTFIPGGIGIREYSAVMLSVLTELTPTHTLLAVTVNRFAGLTGAAFLLLAILSHRRRA